jgi:hypothetical protein
MTGGNMSMPSASGFSSDGGGDNSDDRNGDDGEDDENGKDNLRIPI